MKNHTNGNLKYKKCKQNVSAYIKYTNINT